MKALAPILLLALLAGCARGTPANNVAAAAPAVGLPDAPGPDDGEPGNEAAAETPAEPNSAQAAAQLVRHYFALIEGHNYAEARRLWGNDDAASAMTDGTFAASFQGYEAYHAEVGAPGEPEGAAGSIYVEVPVQIFARRSGRATMMPGTVTLRRVNDVPGATAAQRRWHIARIALESRA